MPAPCVCSQQRLVPAWRDARLAAGPADSGAGGAGAQGRPLGAGPGRRHAPPRVGANTPSRDGCLPVTAAVTAAAVTAAAVTATSHRPGDPVSPLAIGMPSTPAFHRPTPGLSTTSAPGMPGVCPPGCRGPAAQAERTLPHRPLRRRPSARRRCPCSWEPETPCCSGATQPRTFTCWTKVLPLLPARVLGSAPPWTPGFHISSTECL